MRWEGNDMQSALKLRLLYFCQPPVLTPRLTASHTYRFESEAGSRLSLLSGPDERVGGREGTVVGMVGEAREMGEEAGRGEEEVRRGGGCVGANKRRTNTRSTSVRQSSEAGQSSAHSCVSSHSASLVRSLVSESSRRLNRASSGARLDVDSLLRGAEDEASFELGRLKEVCASYRRLVWGSTSGKRGDEYDDDVFLGGRRNIRSRYRGEGKEKVDEALKMMGKNNKE